MGIEGMYHNIIKAVYDKSTADNHTQQWEAENF